MREGYDTAQVCLNGHVIASTAGSNPQFHKSFCDKCGEKTTMVCLECNSQIQGHYHVPGVIGFFDYDAPNFCHNCGQPFEWTKRAIGAAEQLASDDESLEENEYEQFKIDIREITRESPQARASANRLKKLFGKMTVGTSSAIRDILVEIASEAAKKMIWPG